MKVVILVICFIFTVRCQNSNPDDTLTQAVNEVFTFNTSIFEEVTQPPLTGFGPLRRCGEGDRQGIDVCVPYYNCDPTTRTVVQNGATDGFNIIDIRYNTDDNQCDHFLDVCCQVPQNGTSTTSTTEAGSVTPSSSITPPFTSPGVVTERTTLGPTSPSTPVSQRPTPGGTDNGGPGQDDDVGGTWATCGIRNPNGIDFKLSGNVQNEAEYGEFPWQVALLRTNYNKQIHKSVCICGGSLIRPNVVMTAAHCVVGFQAAEITIRAGEWDTQTTKERIPFQERVATRVIMHEHYGDGAINDVALVLLDRPYTKVKSVGTICLPKKDQFIDSQHCFASGWGKSMFGKVGEYSVILKKIELPIVHYPECQRMLRRTRLGPHFRLHPSFTCAGGEAGKDTCTGDGGSPLVCPDPNNPKRYIQAGIVSWGVGCGERGVPGVYTDVTKFRWWIDRRLKELGAF